MDDLMQIKNRDRRPLYVQALEALTALIGSEHLKAGDQLPSEEELANKLGISRSTLREALGYMETHGLISRQQGRGTFISKPYGSGVLGGLERMEPFRVVAQKAGYKSEVVERSVQMQAASARLAASLNIQEGDDLVRIDVVEAIGDCPSMYLEDYLIGDEKLFFELMEFKGSLIQYIINRELKPLSHTRTEIFAVEADKRVAERLKISAGKSVLKLVETFMTSKGDILGLGLAYFLTDHFHFYITRRVY